MRVSVSSKTHFYHEITKLRSGTLHISVSDLLPETAGSAWFTEAFGIRKDPGSIIVHSVDTGKSVVFGYWSPARQMPHSGSKHYDQLIFTNRDGFRNGIVEIKLVVWQLESELKDWIAYMDTKKKVAA